jgi:hypothetical protein
MGNAICSTVHSSSGNQEREGGCYSCGCSKNCLQKGIIFLRMHFFHDLCKRWNENHVVLSPQSKPKKGEEFKITVFPKYVGHLVGHYKAWRVNQKKRVAIAVAASSNAVRALQHNTGVRVSRDFEAQAIPVEPQQPVMQSASNESESTARALQVPPPTMHLAPLPHLQVHQARQAPLTWGVPPPPFHHTASQSKKRARKASVLKLQ